MRQEILNEFLPAWFAHNECFYYAHNTEQNPSKFNAKKIVQTDLVGGLDDLGNNDDSVSDKKVAQCSLFYGNDEENIKGFSSDSGASHVLVENIFGSTFFNIKPCESNDSLEELNNQYYAYGNGDKEIDSTVGFTDSRGNHEMLSTQCLVQDSGLTDKLVKVEFVDMLVDENFFLC